MSFHKAKEEFQNASDFTEDKTLTDIGDGLLQLTKALQYELSDIKKELKAIKDDVRRIKFR